MLQTHENTSAAGAVSATRSLAIPHDDRLPGMTALLDAGLVRTYLGLQRSDAAEGILDCRVVHANYRPGKKCVASYVVTRPNGVGGAVQQLFGYGICFEATTFAKVRGKEIAEDWVMPAIGRPVITLPDHHVLLFAYPNDRKLGSLRILETEHGLRQFLSSYLNDCRLAEKQLTVSLMWPQYRPEKRAVLRCRMASGLTTYLKVYSDECATRMYATLARLLQWQESQADFAIPRPLASTRDGHILMLSSVNGDSLRSLVGSGGERVALERAAEALASLHRYYDLQLPHRTAADHLKEAQRRVQSLAQLTPELSAQVEDIGFMLQCKLPHEDQCSGGFVHGDLGLRNVLVDPRKIGFIDFDGAHNGPVAADLGRITAALRNLFLDRDATEERKLEDAFLQAYCRAARRSFTPEVIAWWTALGLIRFAAKPIRQLEANGVNKAKELLDEALRTLKSPERTGAA